VKHIQQPVTKWNLPNLRLGFMPQLHCSQISLHCGQAKSGQGPDLKANSKRTTGVQGMPLEGWISIQLRHPKPWHRCLWGNMVSANYTQIWKK